MEVKTTDCEAVEARKRADLSVIHCLLLLGLMVLPASIPLLSDWLVKRLFPPVIYALIVVSVPELRRSVPWFRFGEINRRLLLQTFLVILLSVGALLLWHRLLHPDLRFFAQRFAFDSWAQIAAAGLAFSLLNAGIEEMAWRGVLLEGLAARNGLPFALVAQAVCFGVAHNGGIPDGALGMGMAALFGLLLGGLRIASRGMALCIIAHICADATIFTLAMQTR